MRRFNTREVLPDINEINYRFFELNYQEDFNLDFLYDIISAYSSLKYRGFYEKVQYDKENYPVNLGIDFEKYHDNIQIFITNIDWSLIEGNTPIEKGINIIKLYQEELKNTSKCETQNDTDADTENTENSNSGKGDTTSKETNEKESNDFLNMFIDSDGLEELKEKETKLKELKESPSSNFILGEGSNIDKVLKLTKEQSKILDKLAILSTRGKIKSDVKTNKTEIIKMKSYNQVSKVSPISMMLPTFDYKFVNKDLKIRYDKKANKQLLVLAIDASSSMNQPEKISWVNTIILNRLDEVAKGNSNLIICWFEGKLHDNFSIIKNKKDVQNYLKTYKIYNEGGLTDVARVLKEIEKKIDTNFFKVEGVNPQIVILNDGQDRVQPFKIKYQPHAFILGQDNLGFETLIKSNNGHYERFL